MGDRSDDLARRFEAAQQAFIDLLQSLPDEQWRKVGANYPQKLNDEDERRSVGVIAHHVAINGPFIMRRIEAAVSGRALPPVDDFRASNARHAEEQRDVGREEVLRVLGETKSQIAGDIRGIPDEKLEVPYETPVGPMTPVQRIERVLIGHIKMHQGSIEAVTGG